MIANQIPILEIRSNWTGGNPAESNRDRKTHFPGAPFGVMWARRGKESERQHVLKLRAPGAFARAPAGACSSTRMLAGTGYNVHTRY